MNIGADRPSPMSRRRRWINERLAFDALPPDRKIAIFAAAKPVEEAITTGLPDIYAPIQWYRVRSGRSTSFLTTPERIAMLTLMWTADRDHTHGMDAKTRAHFTRISIPPAVEDYDRCREGFAKLPAAERFAALNAAWKMFWPLPKSVPLPEGLGREEQYYQMRVCPRWSSLLPRAEWIKAKDAAFEEMRAAEIADAGGKASRLARSAREKASELTAVLRRRASDKAADIKHKAADKARDVAADVKTKSAQAARDLKGKAEEGVKQGAKGLFQKALGY